MEENLRKKNNCEPDWTELFKLIGKTAYEKNRKQSYLVSYEKIVQRQYETAGFSELVPDNLQSLWAFDYTNGNTEECDSLERAARFFSDFQFYTVFEDDCVNMERYKRVLPDGTDYPLAICEVIRSGQNLSRYGYMKFYNIPDNRIK